MTSATEYRALLSSIADNTRTLNDVRIAVRSVLTSLDEITRERDAAVKRAEEAEATISGLSDPIAVHLNMLRGVIAQPSIANIVHLYAGCIVEAERATAAEELVRVLEAQRDDARAALQSLADFQVAFDANPVGVIETLRQVARNALSMKDAGDV